MMLDAVFHIGSDKCGSSALQTALSKNNIFEIKNSQYKKAVYVATNHKDDICYGDKLEKIASARPNQYLIFNHIPSIRYWSDSKFNMLHEKLKELSENNQNLLIFSNEGLLNHVNLLKKYHFFNKLQLNAKVICYIRNPVELANSAWWQWYAWSETSFEEFILLFIKAFSRLYIKFYKWRELLGENNVTVRLLPQDIIEDFTKFIGAGTSLAKEKNRNNTGLPAEILRFYQKHRELRSSMHKSGLDFILSSVFNFNDKFTKTPWVLSKENINKILKETKESNYKLLEFVDEESKRQILDDLKWWDEDAFSHKKYSTAIFTDDFLTYEQLDMVLLEAIKNIEKLYLENLKLKTDLS